MRRTLVMLAVAAAMVTAMAATATAQEGGAEPGSEGTTLSVKPSPPLPELQAGATQDRARGLAGRTMVSFNVNKRDSRIDRLRVRGIGCRVGNGSYITIRDSDGTIARVIDNRGSQIYRYRSYVSVRGTGANGAIRFYIIQYGNGTLNNYSRVRNSSRIYC